MNWLLLGYGDLAEKRVVRALQTAPGSRLIAVWGRDAEKVSAFAQRHHIDRRFAGEGQLQPALDQPDVDAVYICTPVYSHCPYAVAALTAGKHVLCEKPMARTAGECEQMNVAAADAGRQLAVAYYRRCFPKMIAIRQWIAAGKLGELSRVHVTCQDWFTPDPADPKFWRVVPEHSGGGVAWDIGSHRLDLLGYWFGDLRVVRARRSNRIHTYAAEDTAEFVLEAGDHNRIPIDVLFSWAAKSPCDRLEIAGNKLTLISDPLDGPELIVMENNRRQVQTYPVPGNYHLPVVEDFIAAVQAGKSAICPGNEAQKTNVILDQLKQL